MSPRAQLNDYLARRKHVSPTLGERLDTLIDNATKRHGWFNATRDLKGQPPLVVALYHNREQRREAKLCEWWGWGNRGGNSHEVEFNVAYEAYTKARSERKDVLTSLALQRAIERAA